MCNMIACSITDLTNTNSNLVNKSDASFKRLVDDQAMLEDWPFENCAAALQSVSSSMRLTPWFSAHLVAERIPEHSACSLDPADPEQHPALIIIPLELLAI
ncbi:hypothetical protein FRX31_005125 [Thalictrum thalictroides]|uniref:Uncharacterized protein n=1 Tax=Thalictrum thalictroides TaxID=46969 RepID=A0A7J6X8Q9_THATH|nr:hypothetical protein FRX31_005125 [Thalictrum thalictroides]